MEHHKYLMTWNKSSPWDHFNPQLWYVLVKQVRVFGIAVAVVVVV